VIEGAPPNLLALPAGCAFAPRCRHATTRCSAERPALQQADGTQAFACWNPVAQMQEA
jgi:oligopeptide/dipeptide ABC transporter ATP-binding protein